MSDLAISARTREAAAPAETAGFDEVQPPDVGLYTAASNRRLVEQIESRVFRKLTLCAGAVCVGEGRPEGRAERGARLVGVEVVDGGVRGRAHCV